MQFFETLAEKSYRQGCYIERTLSQLARQLFFEVDAQTKCELHNVQVQYSFQVLFPRRFFKQASATDTDSWGLGQSD